MNGKELLTEWVAWELGRPVESVVMGDDIPSDIGVTTQADDLDAINRYMGEEKPLTKEATRLRDDWVKWYNGLSWYEINFDQNTFDLARNRRNAYNIANTKSQDERKQVIQQIQDGLSHEQQVGEPDRRLSTGMLPTVKLPVVSTTTKIVIGVIGGIAVIAAGHALPGAIASTMVKPKVS